MREERPIYAKSKKQMENGICVEVNDIFMFACVYLTHEEEEDPEVMERLAPLIRKYRAKKYKFAIMHSGTDDLLECTKALLSHNKLSEKDRQDDSLLTAG